MGVNCEVSDESADPAFASSIFSANGNGTQTTLSMMGDLSESATTTLTLPWGASSIPPPSPTAARLSKPSR
jgi:hypothetical protein